MICQRREGGEGQWRLLTQARKKRTQCCTRALKYKVKVQAGFWEREKERERDAHSVSLSLSLSPHTQKRNRRKREDTRHSHTHTLHIYLIHTHLLYIRAHGKQQRLSSGKASFEASSWATATEASPLFEGAAALSCLPPPPPPPLAQDDGCWWCSSCYHRTTAFGCVADALYLFFISWPLAAAAPGLSTSRPRDLEMSPKGLEEGAISRVFSSISSSSSSWQRRGKKNIGQASLCFWGCFLLQPQCRIVASWCVYVCFPSLRSLDIEV